MKAYMNSCPSVLRDKRPQQNTYKFGDVTVSSEFDCGNICDVVQVSERYYTMSVVADGEPYDNKLPFK